MSTEPIIDVRISEEYLRRALAEDVRAGLTAAQKTLPPKWFYDAEGSRLFERITELPEYYPTRAEAEILRTVAAEFAGVTAARTLVELGSGSSEKTRLLLDSLSAKGTLEWFVPLDVSETALRDAATKIAIDYQNSRVHGIVGDFGAHLDVLPGSGPRALAFLGGTIGNMNPGQRAGFLRALHGVLGAGEWLLLGTDLVKDPAVLVPAYDDAAGVTAEFNRNVLRVLNRSLHADFEVEAFEHRAVWNAEQEWIEMRLRATKAMRVNISDLDLKVEFAEGEELRTEISAKFRRDRLAGELRSSGFEMREFWTDSRGLFAVTLARRM